MTIPRRAFAILLVVLVAAGLASCQPTPDKDAFYTAADPSSGPNGSLIRSRSSVFTVDPANRTPVPVSSLVDESYGLDRLDAFMGAADAIVVSLPLTPDHSS